MEKVWWDTPTAHHQHPRVTENTDTRNWVNSLTVREQDLCGFAPPPQELGSDRSLDDGFDMCSMIWFTITDEEADQSDNHKLTNLLVGTERQITDRLKAYKEAGMNMPLIWPPFTGVPVSKTLDDLKRLANDIMPKVNG